MVIVTESNKFITTGGDDTYKLVLNKDRYKIELTEDYLNIVIITTNEEYLRNVRKNLVNDPDIEYKKEIIWSCHRKNVLYFNQGRYTDTCNKDKSTGKYIDELDKN